MVFTKKKPSVVKDYVKSEMFHHIILLYIHRARSYNLRCIWVARFFYKKAKKNKPILDLYGKALIVINLSITAYKQHTHMFICQHFKNVL